jgi:hypothetical protein
MMFYPDAPVLTGASPIDLRPGEDHGNVDFRLEPVPVFRVSGRLEGSPASVANQVVRMLPSGSEDLGSGAEAATALCTQDGAFEFVNVPSGSYTLMVSRSLRQIEQRSDGIVALGLSVSGVLSASGRSIASATSSGIGPDDGSTRLLTLKTAGSDDSSGLLPLVVRDRDITNLVVPMQPATSVSGRVVIDTADKPISGQLGIAFEPARGNPSLGTYNQQGYFDNSSVFAIAGLQSGPYVLRATPPPPMIVKSIQWNGRDYADTPFEAGGGRPFADILVTLTSNIPVLSGSVRREKGAAGAETSVVAFPVDRDQWTGYGFTPNRIQSTAVTASGTYRFASLPAGSYYVVAVSSDQRNAWQDPAWLMAASAVASRVSMGWGDRPVQNLVVVAVKPS